MIIYAKIFFRNWLHSFGFLFLVLLLAGCQKNDNSSGFELLSGDDSKEVIDIVSDANTDLKAVKAIYKKNENRVEDLKTAMSGKDVEKVKSIANDLVLEINDGLVLGKNAVMKIEKAENLNINDTYKEYLGLKKEALEDQLAAFELRRQSAQSLAQNLLESDPESFKKAAFVLKEKEQNFEKLIEAGKSLSLQANEIAKDATGKQKK